MKTTLLRIAAAALAFAAVSCSSKIDMPKGTSRGYTSARLVRADVKKSNAFIDNSAVVDRMIQKALGAEFQAHGMQTGNADAGLVVGYLILVQDNASTLALDDYFGYGRDSSEIADRAHTMGVLKNKRPDVFEAGTIVVDVMDAKTNKLVFRNYATRDVYEGVSASVRQQRVREAVAEALQPFWR